MLHYLPAFTRTDGVRQQAVCGRYVFPMEHSTEPTCPACRAWLGVEPELTHEMVDPGFLPPDFFSRQVGPCATKGCIGLATAPERFCLTCRFKGAQTHDEAPAC